MPRASSDQQGAAAPGETVQTGVHDGVFSIRLNSPETLNALDGPILRSLRQQLHAASDDPDVRVVTIAGNGRGFCSGWSRQAVAEAQTSADRLADDQLGIDVLAAISDVPVPTIAITHGCVVGGAVAIAAACDIRLAREDSFFWLPEGQYGAPLLWAGLGPLVREIGLPAVRELALLSEKLDTMWALRVGLAQQVFPEKDFDHSVRAVVDRMASLPPNGIRLMKQDISASARRLLDPAICHSAADILAALESPEFRRSMTRPSPKQPSVPTVT